MLKITSWRRSWDAEGPWIEEDLGVEITKDFHSTGEDSVCMIKARPRQNLGFHKYLCGVCSPPLWIVSTFLLPPAWLSLVLPVYSLAACVRGIPVSLPHLVYSPAPSPCHILCN